MVIAILTVIVGFVVIASLPVAQFPAIAPPEIQISAIYVGADAQTIEQAVATPIEQQMSGVDNTELHVLAQRHRERSDEDDRRLRRCHVIPTPI